jgi:hypothetical protein
MKIQNEEGGEKKTVGTWITRYAERKGLGDVSFYDYFCLKKPPNKTTGRITIPHFTGVSYTLTLPVRKEYARSILMVHKPWKGKFDEKEGMESVEQYEQFVLNKNCPKLVRISYERAKLNSTTQTNEPTSKHDAQEFNGDDYDVEDAVNIFSKIPAVFAENFLDEDLDFGFEKDWDVAQFMLPNDMTKEGCSLWLEEQVMNRSKCIILL